MFIILALIHPEVVTSLSLSVQPFAYVYNVFVPIYHPLVIPSMFLFLSYIHIHSQPLYYITPFPFYFITLCIPTLDWVITLYSHLCCFCNGFSVGYYVTALACKNNMLKSVFSNHAASPDSR